MKVKVDILASFEAKKGVTAGAEMYRLTKTTDMPQLPPKGVRLTFGDEEEGLAFSGEKWTLEWSDANSMYRILIFLTVLATDVEFDETYKRFKSFRKTWTNLPV